MIVREILIEEICPAPYNPRKDLKPGDPEYEKLRQVMGHFDGSGANDEADRRTAIMAR